MSLALLRILIVLVILVGSRVGGLGVVVFCRVSCPVSYLVEGFVFRTQAHFLQCFHCCGGKIRSLAELRVLVGVP